MSFFKVVTDAYHHTHHQALMIMSAYIGGFGLYKMRANYKQAWGLNPAPKQQEDMDVFLQRPEIKALVQQFQAPVVAAATEAKH